MTQIKTKIPAELEPAAVGGMVTDSKYVKDRVKNKTQEEVNADTEERVSTLEESVGTGGSVDERIAVEKNRAEQAEGVLDGKVATEKQRAEGVEGGLNTRLQTVEELATISVGGGDIGIGTAADFESDDPSDLAKVPTIGAIHNGTGAGSYIENLEFIEVKIDKDGKILEARKIDGTKVEYNDLEVRGIIINKVLDSKVDKENGKSLIGEEVAEALSYSLDIKDYVYAIIDNSNKIVLGIKKDGKVYPLTEDIENVYKQSLEKVDEKLSQYPIPDFVHEATRKTYKRIVEWANGDDIFMLGQVTDVHSNGTDKYKVVDYLSKIGNIIGVDVLGNFGDIGLDTGDTTGQPERVFEVLYDTKREMNGNMPWIFMKGNHERLVSLQTLGQIYNKSFNTVYKNYVFGDSYGNYGYIDNEQKKVRTYFINTTDTPTTDEYAISVEQFTWFISSLDDVADDWNVVVCSHVCPDEMADPINFPTQHTLGNLPVFKDILTSFANHTSGSNVSLGLEWDFTNSRAKLVCEFAGHAHFNNFAKVNGVNYIVRQGFQANPGQMPAGATAPSIDWHQQCCFDILAVKNNGNAKVFRIGVGDSDLDLSINY